jgi:hypothetical protein
VSRLFYDGAQVGRAVRKFCTALAVAFVLILGITAVGILAIQRREARLHAERQALSVGELIVWRDLVPLIPTLDEPPEAISSGSTSDSRVIARLDALDTVLLNEIRHFDVFKIKIFGSDRSVRYSNDRSTVGKLDENNPRLNAALAGEVVSVMKSRHSMPDLEGESHRDVDMVETYFPLRGPDGGVIGAFELYMDVTPYRQQHRQVAFLSIGVVFFALAVGALSLAAMVRYLTGVIRSRTEKLRVLEGMLPICSFCKKVRAEDNQWMQIEKYVAERSDSDFTHSVCPECMEAHYPETAD